MAVARFGEARDVSVARELAYFGRHAWVSFKETVGLSRQKRPRPTTSTASCAPCSSGALGRSYGILATGKNDGAGSQAQAAMSALCFAQAFGLEYVHRPFTIIEHAEGPMEQWVRQWEDYFNLGAGARRLGQRGDHVVPLDELLMAPEKWPDTAIVAAPHYLHYCNQDPQAWERVTAAVARKFWQNKEPPTSRPFTIALHVRRGDVTADNKKVARNFTPNATFLRTLERIMARGRDQRPRQSPHRALLARRSGDLRRISRAPAASSVSTSRRSPRTARSSRPTSSSCRRAPSATPRAY